MSDFFKVINTAKLDLLFCQRNTYLIVGNDDWIIGTALILVDFLARIKTIVILMGRYQFMKNLIFIVLFLGFQGGVVAQIAGPISGSSILVGNHMITYQATVNCKFHILSRT